MEVHAHTHTARKKWTHYFWEFLMLFIAVTLGFFVENQREHFVEKQWEKQFIKTLLEDIRNDTASMGYAITSFTNINNHIDSLIPFLNDNRNMESNAKKIYQHAVWLQTFYKVTYFDRTIEQLKSSGNFRLIRNKKVSRSIMEYDGAMRDNVLDMQNKFIHERKEIILNLSNDIFKTSVAKKWFTAETVNMKIELPEVPYFLTTEKKDIDKLINHLNQYSLAITWFMSNLKNWATVKAVHLDSLIKHEYQLK
jgi:hypothetical protein